MDQNFIRGTLSRRGKEKGQIWLDDIPKLVNKYEKKWDLKSEGTFEELSINFIEEVKTLKNEKAILKIGFPDDEFLSEIKTLIIYDGDGAVKVLNKNEKDYILLLEKCIPGKPLQTLNNEEKEILIFAGLCKKIWKKIPNESDFKKLSGEEKYFDWYFENLDKCKDSLPEDLVIRAQEKFDNLIKTQGENYLLHSDLHHDNILSSARGWLAIDPKGLIGEREYEAGSFIRNPHKKFKDDESFIDQEFFKTRIKFIAEALDFDRQRIAEWAFIKQILAMIWGLEDYKSGNRIELSIAKELEKLI